MMPRPRNRLAIRIGANPMDAGSHRTGTEVKNVVD